MLHFLSKTRLLSNTNILLLLIFIVSNDDAGLFGAVLIIGGLVGAGLAGHLMERTKAYRTILKGGFLACSFSMILLAFMLRKNNFNLVLLSFALLGKIDCCQQLLSCDK